MFTLNDKTTLVNNYYSKQKTVELRTSSNPGSFKVVLESCSLRE